VTFGCLNNFSKVTPAMLRLWSQVMRGAANSRLHLMAPHGSARSRTLEILAAEGIDASRVTFIEKTGRIEYLRRFCQIDISLDTLPYNGHTTTLDSLWMGVPVVTLVGRTVVGRAGLSLLSNIGLLEFIARSEKEFVETSLRLAANLQELARLRATLRDRMERSPLMDAAAFTRGIEAAYQGMWELWRRERRI
jgi:predicted O-linked N-acetylglucosamine transferase (SPINDLY family)